MLSTSTVRLCGSADLPAVLAALDRDPVTHVFVASRVRAAGLEPWRLGGELWAHVVDDQIDALCYSGANLVPAGVAGPASEQAVAGFADRALRQGRHCSSIVGPAQTVAALWDLLAPHWGPARDMRARQPVCVIAEPPAVRPDPLVRPVRPEEVDLLLPASVAMFTEEVGVSPLAHDGGTLYRARVAELVASGRSFARIEQGRVLFKAEVGAVSPQACQVQGVWVPADRRGEGLAVRGMAAVVEFARAWFAPVVSLYVNDYNTVARAVYARVGFRETGAFASVLF